MKPLNTWGTCQTGMYQNSLARLVHTFNHHFTAQRLRVQMAVPENGIYLANGNLSKEHEIRGVLFSDHPRYQKKFYNSIYLFVYLSTFPSVPWIHMDPFAKGIVICGNLRALSWLLAWPSSTEVMDAMEATEAPTNGGGPVGPALCTTRQSCGFHRVAIGKYPTKMVICQMLTYKNDCITTQSWGDSLLRLWWRNPISMWGRGTLWSQFLSQRSIYDTWCAILLISLGWGTLRKTRGKFQITKHGPITFTKIIQNWIQVKLTGRPHTPSSKLGKWSTFTVGCLCRFVTGPEDIFPRIGFRETLQQTSNTVRGKNHHFPGHVS